MVQIFCHRDGKPFSTAFSFARFGLVELELRERDGADWVVFLMLSARGYPVGHPIPIMREFTLSFLTAPTGQATHWAVSNLTAMTVRVSILSVRPMKTDWPMRL